MDNHESSGRPWQWLPDEGQFIVDAKGNVVAEIPCQGCNPADGELIVTAVNSYDALVEENERLKAHIKDLDADLNGTIKECNDWHVDGRTA